MTCFVDNDIIHKLSAFDMLSEAWGVLDKKEHDVRILPTARYKFYVAKNQPKGIKKYGEVVFDRIKNFVLNAAEIDRTNSEDEDALQNILGIDPGEVVLFSAAARDPSSILVTGDKVAIRALVNAERCSSLVDRLRGRVVSLEHLMLRLIRAHGFAYVQEHVVPSMQCDNATRAAFGSGMLAKEDDVVTALSAYVADLPPKFMMDHAS